MTAEIWIALGPFWAMLSLSVTLAIRVFALGVIPGNRKPSTGVAWLLLVMLWPILGIVIFWFFGNPRLGRRRAERQREAHEATKTAFAAADSSAEAGLEAHDASIVHLAHRLGAMPLKTGNSVEFLPGYAETVARMTAEVAEASEYVHVEFYIAARDEVTAPLLDAMAAAARRGVDVRFLYDYLGTKRIPGYREFVRWLETTGIRHRPMLPLSIKLRRFRRPDLRNHRKLLVVDGRSAFMGSMNMIEPGYNKPKNHERGLNWVELMCRVTGPSVAALDAVFAADWYTETAEVLDVPPPLPRAGGVAAQVLPSGPGFESESNLRVFSSLISSATERLSVTSPYFVPDESLLYTLTTAALRGVEVELFVSEVSDQFMVGHAQASYYRSLLQAGVRIWQYPEPAILHSKHFTVDDRVAVIGSSNMDMRSFSLNYEVSMVMFDEGAVVELRRVEDSYREISTELKLEEWLRRPRRLKYLDNVFRLTSALQ